MRVETFRFKKDLVAVPIPETMDLVFDGRAIPRPPTFDRPSKQRRTIEASPNDVMTSLVSPGYGATELRLGGRIGRQSHGPNPPIARLRNGARPIDGSCIEPWWRPSLEVRRREAKFADLRGQGAG